MNGQGDITPWAAQFKHHLEIVGTNDQPPMSTSNIRQATYTALTTAPQTASTEALQYPAALRIVRPMSYAPASRDSWAPPTVEPRQPIAAPVASSFPRYYRRSTAPNTSPSRPISTASVPTITLSRPPQQKSRPQSTFQMSRPQSYLSNTRPHSFYQQSRPQSIYDKPLPHNPLILQAHNLSQTHCLRKYLHWITGLPDIHRLQGINHAQATDTASLTAPAIVVLRNLFVLRDMYLPARVSLPTPDAYDVVEAIYGILDNLKTEMDFRLEELESQSRALTPTAFIDWLSYHYRSCGRRLPIPAPGIFYNPDSLTDQLREVEKAIVFYSSAEVMYDNSPTNTFADVIVRALKGYVPRLLPKYKEGEKGDFILYYEAYKAWKESKKAKEAAKRRAPERSMSDLGDSLLYEHAEPGNKHKR